MSGAELGTRDVSDAELAGRAHALSQMELRIRRTAVDLFFQKGFSAVGIRQLGSHVGIALPTLYHYVSSKSNLLESIMIDTHEILLDRLLVNIEGIGDPRDRLARLTGVLVATQASSPKTSFVVDNEVRTLEEASVARQSVLSLRDDVERLWRETLEEGVRSDAFRVENLQTVRLALIGMATSTSAWFRASGRLSLEAVCHDYIQIAMRIVDAPPLDDSAISKLIEQFPVTPFPWEPSPA